MDLPLNLALFLMGFNFIVTQVVVIRELLVVFIGNELSIAIILANWLFLGALGSYLLGRKAEDFRLGKASFALLQILQALFLPLTILVIRSLREGMGFSPGEGASLWQVLSWTFPLLAPLGMTGSMMFALGCSLYNRSAQRAGFSVGRVYLWEALGAGIGGAVYPLFLVSGLHSFQIAYLMGAANCLSGFLLIRARRGETKTFGRIWIGSLLGLVAVSLGLLSFPPIVDLETISLRRQWVGFSVLQVVWTPYGNLTVSQREDQITIHSNGLPVLTAPVPDIAQLEERVHFPLLSHDTPERVLIVGGGLGGVIAEVLKHPVHEVHYVDLDPLMIELAKKYANPPARFAIEDPRVHIHTMDGRLFIKRASIPFDLVLVNLPGPFTLQLNRFYTAEFFREVWGVLRGKGILAFALPGAEAYFNKEVRDLNVNLLETLKTTFPSVWVIPGNLNLIFASRSADPRPADASVLKKRLAERNLSTQFLSAFHLDRKLDPGRKAWMEDSFSRGRPAKANLDSNPSGLYYGIAYWNAEFHPAFQKFWGPLERFPLSALWLGLFLLVGSGIALSRKWPRIGDPLVLSGVTGTTGFFGMAGSILIIFSFQTLHGYVYQWIGLLIGTFMVGLAVGSWQMAGRVEGLKDPWKTLGLVESMIVVLAISGMVLFWISHSLPLEFIGRPLWSVAFPLFNSLAGFLVGLEFPLANALWMPKGGGVARGAGSLYAADLLGAGAGALLVGVILIPVFGLTSTFGIIIGLKAGSCLWVFLRS